MDRSWINCVRITQFVQRNANNSGQDGENIRCHCVNCLNGRILDIKKIWEHLLCDRSLRSYTTWTWPGELLKLPHVFVTEEYVESTMDDVVHDEVDND